MKKADIPKVNLIAGMFILLAVAEITYYISEINQDKLYKCDAGEDTIIGLCFKLSSVNDEGLQTRCYYNESAPRRYKNCKTGWNKVEYEEITGTETELDDEKDIFDKTVYKDYDSDFDNKTEAEEYVDEIKTDLLSEYEITRTEQRLNTKNMYVYWIVRLFKNVEEEYEECIYDEKTEEESCETKLRTVRDYIHVEELSSKVPEIMEKEDIIEIVEKHYSDYIFNWNPDIKIVKNAK